MPSSNEADANVVDPEGENAWEKGVELTETPESQEADVIQYEISYYPADLTLKGYYDKWLEGQLEIPEFQRAFIWDRVRASKLIESFLLGLPVPGVFLYKQRKTNKLLVIDGQQRIMSAISYFENDFNERPFRLTNINEQWNGKAYKELDEPEKFQINDTVLRATIIQQLHPDDDSSIYHIFERLNTGGVNLTPMEVRKCVYFGDYFNMLESLNQISGWRDLIGKPRLDKRLRDAELVLRVLALKHRWRDYEKPMKQFLNWHMQSMRRLGEDALSAVLKEDQEEFRHTVDALIAALPERPFHLRGNRLNYAALDSFMAVAMETGERDSQRLKAAYASLLDNDEYLQSVRESTSDEKVLNERFGLTMAAFGQQ